MASNVDVRTSVDGRSSQSTSFMRELKFIAGEIVTQINAGELTGKTLIFHQNKLTQAKNSFGNWPYGSLTDNNVRLNMVQNWPDTYTNPAQVQTDLNNATSNFASLQAALEVVFVIARANGQLVDSDPVDHLEITQDLISPDTDALLIEATAVRDSIDG